MTFYQGHFDRIYLNEVKVSFIEQNKWDFESLYNKHFLIKLAS